MATTSNTAFFTGIMAHVSNGAPFMSGNATDLTEIDFQEGQVRIYDYANAKQYGNDPIVYGDAIDLTDM